MDMPVYKRDIIEAIVPGGTVVVRGKLSTVVGDAIAYTARGYVIYLGDGDGIFGRLNAQACGHTHVTRGVNSHPRQDDLIAWTQLLLDEFFAGRPHDASRCAA